MKIGFIRTPIFWGKTVRVGNTANNAKVSVAPSAPKSWNAFFIFTL